MRKEGEGRARIKCYLKCKTSMSDQCSALELQSSLRREGERESLKHTEYKTHMSIIQRQIQGPVWLLWL